MTTNRTEQGRVSALLQLIDRQKTQSTTTGANDADLYPSSSRLNTSEVEKHLDDVKKGKGYLSKQVNRELRKSKSTSASALAETDPALARMYNSFSTAFSYSKSARFIQGVERIAKTSKKLLAIS